MDLHPYREQIDALDDEIVRLFARRMEIVAEMMRLKKQEGIPSEDSGREAEIVGRLSEQVHAPLRPAVARLYETIFSIGKEGNDGNSSYLWTNETNATTMAKYVCDLCGYEYDPANGDPDAGIPAGTTFENLPADWVCPLCGAGKGDFSAK